MSGKKATFSIIGALLLAGLIYLIVVWQDSDKEAADYVIPQLQFAQMRITNLTAERADMQMKMVLDNPAPIGLSIDSLHYIVSIQGHEVVKTSYPDSLQIEANDTTSFSLPLTIYYNDLQSVLEELEQQGKDSAMYKINATIFSDIDVIPKDEFDLEVEQRLPLIRIPEVKINDLSVEDVGLSGAVIVVEALIKNDNIFSFGFEDMDYSLQIDDNETVEGHKQEAVTVPAKDVATISIPIEVDFKEMAKSVIDLIKEGEDLTFNFFLTTEMNSDEHILEESKITLNATGNLKEMKEIAEEQAADE